MREWIAWHSGRSVAILVGVLNVYVPKAESTQSSKITVSESGDGST